MASATSPIRKVAVGLEPGAAPIPVDQDVRVVPSESATELDELLMLRVAKGEDCWAFHELRRRHRRWLWMFYRFQTDCWTAHRWVELTFQRAWRGRHEYPGWSSVRAWLVALGPGEAADTDSQPDAARDTSPNGSLLAAIRTLPVEQRRALVLLRLCQLRYHEVEQVENLPNGLISRRVLRGEEQLRLLLAQQEPPTR